MGDGAKSMLLGRLGADDSSSVGMRPLRALRRCLRNLTYKHQERSEKVCGCSKFGGKPWTALLAAAEANGAKRSLSDRITKEAIHLTTIVVCDIH